MGASHHEAMLIHLNGYPGTGKLTIAQALAPMLGARLLDNHSVYNIAFALTEPKTPVFYDTVRALRRIAYDRVLALPAGVPVILTNAHAADSAWGAECWDALRDLARTRAVPLLLVTLLCTPEEQDRRIQNPGRAALRKPRDPHMFPGNRQGRALMERGGDALLRLEVSSLSAQEAASTIRDWVASEPLGRADHAPGG